MVTFCIYCLEALLSVSPEQPIGHPDTLTSVHLHPLIDWSRVNNTSPLRMIRHGKLNGWLSNSHNTLQEWTEFENVVFNNIKIDESKDSHGLGIVMTPETLNSAHEPLMTVPRNLIVSKDMVLLHAKADVHLRDVLKVLGEWGMVPIPPWQHSRG